MKNKILETIDFCKVIDKDEYLEIELPVVTYFNYQRVVLRIYPLENEYYISDEGLTFSECGGSSEYYYNSFIDNDSNYHFDILLDNDYLYKKYDGDYAVYSAIDEFVRFFIYLDDYMTKNSDKL